MIPARLLPLLEVPRLGLAGIGVETVEETFTVAITAVKDATKVTTATRQTIQFGSGSAANIATRTTLLECD